VERIHGEVYDAVVVDMVLGARIGFRQQPVEAAALGIRQRCSHLHRHLFDLRLQGMVS
jgi:hypothetical protein